MPHAGMRSSSVNVDLDRRKRWLALMVLCLGVLMIVLDTTISTRPS